jgi:L-ribulose-5-phosphate 4-epimerase
MAKLISTENDIVNSFHHLKSNIVFACRIIVDQKIDSGPFGNVSIRIPGTKQFYINPAGITFDQLDHNDILRVDVHNNVLEGEHEPHPGEFIHREIYRLREDVEAIVHTHSENTVAISLLGCEIEPFTQLGAAIFGDQGVYQGFSGPVRTLDEGKAIAQALGDKSIVIAKNHGLFAVGSTIQAVLWDMIIADMAAKIHLTARQLGLHHADKLSPEYMHKSKIEVRNKQCEFMWKSYLNKIGAE